MKKTTSGLMNASAFRQGYRDAYNDNVAPSEDTSIRIYGAYVGAGPLTADVRDAYMAGLQAGNADLDVALTMLLDEEETFTCDSCGGPAEEDDLDEYTGDRTCDECRVDQEAQAYVEAMRVDHAEWDALAAQRTWNVEEDARLAQLDAYNRARGDEPPY